MFGGRPVQGRRASVIERGLAERRTDRTRTAGSWSSRHGVAMHGPVGLGQPESRLAGR